MARIIVEPQVSFADESVAVKISGLGNRQQVTLYSRQANDKGKEFLSCAFYQANDVGIVDLSTDAALGGFYKGVQPMGLFWAMKTKGYSTMIKLDSRKPDVVTIDVLDGHQDLGIDLSRDNQFIPLVSIEVQRLYLDPQVDRISVNSGDVRGVMFLPRRKEEIPGVLDVAGLFGGVMEGRASLIARKGFAVFCLSLYGLPDQPKHLSVIDLEVIEKAVDFLQTQHGVSKTGSGIIGMSYGGTIVLAASGCIKKLSCAINISGPVFALNRTDFKYKNRTWKHVKPDADRVQIKDGKRHVKGVTKVPLPREMGKHIPDFHKSATSVLFQYGADDILLNLDDNIAVFQEMFKLSGKLNYKICRYDGAGHGILLPNKPLIPAMYLSSHHAHPTAMGGVPEKHAKGQEQAWKDAIEFLTCNLYSRLPSRL